MVSLGFLVNSKDFTLRVPESRLRELSDELHLWLSRECFTVKELQSLLGKLSFVTACVHASRIFVSRLLNALRSFPSNAKSHEISTSHVGNASRLGLVANFSSPLQWCFGYQASSQPTGPLLIFVSPRMLVWLAAEPRASTNALHSLSRILSTTPRLTSLLWNSSLLLSRLSSGPQHCDIRDFSSPATTRRRLPWSIQAPPRILSCRAVCASCGSPQRFMMLPSASGIFPASITH